MDKDTKTTAHKKGKPAGTSREAQWIGLLVLGFGALCILAVGFFIFGHMRGGAQDGDAAVQQQLSQNNQSNALQQTKKTEPDDVRTELSRSLDSIRDSGAVRKKSAGQDAEVTEAQIRGSWETIMKKNMTGIMDLSKGRYRIILASDSAATYRFFSNGTYEVVAKNILILNPSPGAQAPNDGFLYRQLYNQSFSVQIKRDGDYMLWSRPPASAPGRNPANHPLLRLADDNIMIWKAF